jgi:4-amino-4-deoxy-L-arabinose transferase-like glycosyltransferase
VAASGSTLGWTEFAVRLVSALTALAGIVIVGRLGTSMGGPRAGIYASLLLAVAPYWALLARVNSIDMTLSALILATLACFWRASSGGSGARLAWHGLFAFSALAVLTKGLIGIVLPGGAILLYLAIGGHWRLLRSVPWLTGPLLFSVIAVPWHLFAESQHHGFLYHYFVSEHFLRYTTGVYERTQPAWYLAVVLFVGLLPWSGLIPSAVRLPFRAAPGLRRDAALFLSCWAGFVLAFFSLSGSKLIPYVLPAAPPLALLVGLTLVDAEEAPGRTLRFGRWLLTISLLLVAIVFAVFLWFGSGRSAEWLGGVSVYDGAVVVTAVIALLATAAAVLAAPRASLSRVIASTVIAAVGLIPCCVIAGGVIADRASARAIVRYINLQGADAELIAFRCYPRTATFYLHRTIAVVDHDGEFAYGKATMDGAELSRRFPDIAELKRRWLSGDGHVFVITPRRNVAKLAKLGIRGTVAVDSGRFLLLKQELSKPLMPAIPAAGVNQPQ